MINTLRIVGPGVTRIGWGQQTVSTGHLLLLKMTGLFILLFFQLDTCVTKFFFFLATQHVGFPHQGSNTWPLRWEHGVLTTGAAREVPRYSFCIPYLLNTVLK